MSNIAIIPARGGSKRIPRKNIKEFLGKPIIAYSIQAALQSQVFDEVMVSTDDPEIADISKSFGASVPFLRSGKNSDDYASTLDVIQEVLNLYQSVDEKFENGCCIYPTAPFVTGDILKQGLEKLTVGRYDTVFPVCKFSYPIWRALKIEGGRVRMIWPENLKKRSQDFPSAYHDAGQWYWFNCSQLISDRMLWTENTFGLEVDEMQVQDIDNESDWEIAELKYRYTHR
jgi:pseudaminic acid cytidylyltransferase